MIRNLVFWMLAVLLTLACLTYQDRTGPTYPLEGDFKIAGESVVYKFQRSENIGRDLPIVLVEPVPDGITGFVRYRRFMSDDQWQMAPLLAGTFSFSRRGRSQSLDGVGALLPGLRERAGKYEYRVFVIDGKNEPVSVTGKKPVYARYKAEVPSTVLLLHVVVIFLSMILGIRTVLETVVNGNYKWMIWATAVTLLLGGFLLGPLVQWHAFGVWWSGVPFGYDWTDNKVLVELAAWILALFLNRGDRRNRRSVYLAGLIMLAVYFIPHSLFGSQYNYLTGKGHGTAG